jgi:hypothetical protein
MLTEAASLSRLLADLVRGAGGELHCQLTLRSGHCDRCAGPCCP